MKNKKKKIFWIFFTKVWKNVEKGEKVMKKGHILQKKAKIDEKLEKEYFLDFFQESMEKCRKK